MPLSKPLGAFGMTTLLMGGAGALSTFLVSRFLLWTLRRWEGGWTRLAAANGAALIAALAVAAAYLPTHRNMFWDVAGLCLAAQVLWFAWDAVRHLNDGADGERHGGP